MKDNFVTIRKVILVLFSRFWIFSKIENSSDRLLCSNSCELILLCSNSCELIMRQIEVPYLVFLDVY